ncbi:hypothetical protein ACLMJK_004156 [Lecanora helva]
MPPLSQSASISSTAAPVDENGTSNAEDQIVTEPLRFFFQERYAKLGVKGNFMPLAAQPTNVELADWLAHQTVEHFRIVSTIVQVIFEVDGNTGRTICNNETCPKMTAGRHVYTWLDARKEPLPVSAFQYISLVQRWMNNKIHDQKAFPTDPSPGDTTNYAPGSLSNPIDERSMAAGPGNPQAPLTTLAGHDWIGKSAGFPETFLNDVRTCFRQIFRVYAHLYHAHWVDPFWHLSGKNNAEGWTDLNSCFVHFCSVAKLYGLLSDKDAQPMQPLIDIWIANGSIPADAANGACAVGPQ